jgi:hypothetical protein
MPLDRLDVVDLVSMKGDTVTAHLIVTTPWATTGDDTLLLQAKLKNYVAYAADGQLVRQYPQAAGKRVTIEIRSAYALGATELRLVQAAREHWCSPEGITLLVTIVGPDDAA